MPTEAIFCGIFWRRVLFCVGVFLFIRNFKKWSHFQNEPFPSPPISIPLREFVLLISFLGFEKCFSDLRQEHFPSPIF